MHTYLDASTYVHAYIHVYYIDTYTSAMCVLIVAYLHMCACKYIYTHTYETYVSIYTYVYVSKYTYICLICATIMSHMCNDMYILTHTHVSHMRNESNNVTCIYVHAYVHAHICKYINIKTHKVNTG